VSGALGSPADNVQVIGRSIFTTYLLAFEVTSALLAVAVVGAVVLARRPRPGPGGNGAPLGAVVEPDAVIDDPGVAAPETGEAGTVDVETAGSEPGGGEPGGSERGGSERGGSERGVSEPSGELAHMEVIRP
jgi:hypothetical protein